MRIELKFAGLFGFAAVVALLAIAVAASTAGASEFKTRTFPVGFLGEGLGNFTFLSQELNSISCKNSHNKGEFASFRDVKLTITYLNDCLLTVEKSVLGKFKEACSAITTHELLIVPLENLNAGIRSGLLILPTAGQTIATFTCSGSNKVEVKVKGSVVCESKPVGFLITKGIVTCKANLAKHGEQEFTTGTLPEGKTATASLTAESTLSIFKTTEKDSLETTEDITYSNEIEQTTKDPACEEEKAKWVFCSGDLEANGTQVVKGTIGAATFKSITGGVALEIKCTKGEFGPTLEPGNDLTGLFKLEKCTVVMPAGTCKVHNEQINTGSVGGELEGAVSGPPEVKLGVTGSWGEIEIEGCAAIEGKYILTGTQKCTVDATYNNEEAEHEFKCAEAGSSLKLELNGSKKNEAANLALAVKGPLTSKANWSMRLN